MRRRAGSRFAKGNGCAIAAALFSVLLASCTSSTDPNLEIGMPGYNATAATTSDASSGDLQSAGVDVAPQPEMSAEGDTPLPAQVASVPASNPAGETASTVEAEAGATPAAVSAAVTETAKPAEVAAVSGAEAAAENATASAMPVTPQPIALKKKGLLAALFAPPPAAKPAETVKPAEVEAAADAMPASAAAPTPKPSPAADEAKPAETAPAAEAEKTPAAENAVYVTAGEMPAAQPIAPKKKGFLSAFFGAAPASAAPSPIKQREEPKPIVETDPDETKPIITLASAKEKPVRMASLGDDNALPGVRQTALFEIKRKSGIDDDSDIDLHEGEDGGPVLLASAAGLARLAPNGLLKQTERVDVACLKPSLVRVLKTVERHYGKKMIITSGYRSPAHNRRARGAKNSQHMYCAAADVQIPGVSKWELAKLVRSMPGRGGVGTYCHTNSVHIDVGPERDWNWRCRRRKG